jgi:predicted DNA-binding transcriptional regulator YafY
MYRRGDLSPIARAYRVVEALRGYRRGRTLQALASQVDASVRTIRRDIAGLNDAGIQIDLVSIDGEPGACLIDRGYATVAVTTRERFTLLAARSMFDVFRGSALHDDVLSVMEKLEQRGDAPSPTSSGDRIAYIPSGGVKSYADKADVIDAFQTGILRGRVVRYTYKDSGRRTQRGRTAPLAMLVYRQGLYVIGASVPIDGAWRDGLRVFAIERFTDAEALRDARFEAPPDFALDDLLHGAFGVHVAGGDPQQVVIEFSEEKADYVRARVWHPRQLLDELPDGRMRFSFSCVNLTPVVSWVLEWGPHARVIAPGELRARVLAELDAARAHYR